jgi:hypothetical protein
MWIAIGCLVLLCAWYISLNIRVNRCLDVVLASIKEQETKHKAPLRDQACCKPKENTDE